MRARTWTTIWPAICHCDTQIILSLTHIPAHRAKANHRCSVTYGWFDKDTCTLSWLFAHSINSHRVGLSPLVKSVPHNRRRNSQSVCYSAPLRESILSLVYVVSIGLILLCYRTMTLQYWGSTFNPTLRRRNIGFIYS